MPPLIFNILLKADGFAVDKQHIIKLNADNRALVKNAAAVRFAYNTAELVPFGTITIFSTARSSFQFKINSVPFLLTLLSSLSSSIKFITVFSGIYALPASTSSISSAKAAEESAKSIKHTTASTDKNFFIITAPLPVCIQPVGVIAHLLVGLFDKTGRWQCKGSFGIYVSLISTTVKRGRVFTS